MKFIIGKKLAMTQVWQKGNCLAATQVLAFPCLVSQIKTLEKDGYKAVQVAFGDPTKKFKAKRLNKPQVKHLEKAKALNSNSALNLRNFKEFRAEFNLNLGDIISPESFVSGDKIDVIATSKGKGFQGVVKRHGFGGALKTHGTKDQVRMPGSAGSTGPAHVLKGMRMGGRTGDEKITIKNLEVLEVDPKNNILLVKGAIPGARNGLVTIIGTGEIKVAATEVIEKAEKAEKLEEIEEPESKEAENKANLEEVKSE